MGLEGGPLGGLVATVGTRVRFLPSVRSHVHHHRGIPAGAVGTEGAGVWLLPGVAVDVLLHGSLPRGLVRAVLAGKLLPIIRL